MIHLLWIALIVACQPLADNTGELAAHGDGKRVYFNMALSDVGVKQDTTITDRFDKSMPTKIHALRYGRSETENPLMLVGDEIKLNVLINLSNVIFSWHYPQSGGAVYTCHMHAVSLGEQRDVIAKNSSDVLHCFVQTTGANHGSEQNYNGDYVRLLADYCAKASDSMGSRFIFLDDKDFACNLSQSADKKELVLQASCLANESHSRCLEGKLLKCAAQTVGFENFIARFKERVKTQITCNDNMPCTVTYELESDTDAGQQIAQSNPPAGDNAKENNKNLCAALASPAEMLEQPTDQEPEEGG